MSDALRDVRSRVDPGSKAAAAALVSAIADHDDITTSEILSIADTREVCRWLATETVAARWVRDRHGYRDRLRARAEAELTRAQRELRELAAKGDPL
ncbi:MAG: hypothetical protein M3492_04780 [Actinomycetota bacterium]|nr:hypothetical protein [Actinomycetota bacterium]